MLSRAGNDGGPADLLSGIWSSIWAKITTANNRGFPSKATFVTGFYESAAIVFAAIWVYAMLFSAASQVKGNKEYSPILNAFR